jgi:ribosomal protein S12 methylthiotransferase accessory factor
MTAVLAGLPAAAAALIDGEVGIVGFAEESPRQAEEPDLFRFVARACNTRAFCAQENFAYGGGAAVTREAAAAKAIGEAVERYCAAQYVAEELPLTSAGDPRLACVDPADFALYTGEQYASAGFPFVPFDRATTIRWVETTDALTGAPAHVPACMVYVPYAPDPTAGDQPIAQPISTGLALHSSPEAAAVSAIAEVIERDAFTLAWQGRLSPPRIRVGSLSAANRDLVRRFEAVGDVIHLLDITTDVEVCTILAVRTCDADDPPALSVAASTSLDPEAAVRKSLEELAHTSRYMWGIKDQVPAVPREPEHAAVVDQLTHLRYWSDRDALPHAAFLWRGEDERDFEELSDRAGAEPWDDFETMVRRIDAVGHRTLLADLTTSDVGDLGLCVFRAIVPGFHPLTVGHRIRALGGPRLASVLREGGRRAANPFPHPYP